MFLAPLQANASAKKPRPFDLSKIPTDDSWEDTGIMAEEIKPCGRDYVYMGLKKIKAKNEEDDRYRLHVRNMVTGDEQLSAAEPYQHEKFIGCTPDSRFLFIENSPYQLPSELHVYDTATMKKALTITSGSESGGAPSLHSFSPDGRYLLTDEKKSSIIILPDGRKITLLPLEHQLGGNVISATWSADSKKVYAIIKRGPDELVIYDVETGKQRVVVLKYNDSKYSDHIGVGILVHPETGKVYIHAGFADGMELSSVEYLFMFDPAELPKKGKRNVVKPKFLGNIFATVECGPGGTLLFSMMPDQEGYEPSFPKAYEGIFLADSDGKVLKRVTKSEGKDEGCCKIYPRFMPERNFLIVTRQNVTLGDEPFWRDTIYRKKNFQQPR